MMTPYRVRAAMLATAIFVVLSLAVIALAPVWAQESVTVRGVVMDDSGPLAGSVVRLQTETHFTVTDAQGRFELTIPPPQQDVRITAWMPGYLTGWATIPGGTEGTLEVVITPTRHYATDNPDYNWFSHEGASGSLSCSHCMPCYTEWRLDAHSQSALNPRFLSLYNGTTLTGRLGVPTAYRFDPDLGIDVPVAPSLGQGEGGVGPGFRLDFPDQGGNCAACHVPGAAARSGNAHNTDIQTISGIDTEGVFCEFCHKIGEVRVNPVTGLPNPDLPGVLSMRLYRPEADQQLFFGPFDDVARRVSYLPLQEQSRFCASCHFGAFWGVVMYNSFGEWLDSPYSDPETGRTCQSCHMPPVSYDYFVYPAMGGLHRDPARILSHTMPGALDEAFLQTTAEVEIEAVRDGDALAVTVRVTNTGAGHHIPTDNPLRNVILLVNALDAEGNPLAFLDGATIPAWGGVGDPTQGYYAGLPGVLYAKVLADFYTGETPTYAYWRQTRLVSDNRIPALATDESHYRFALPTDAGEITVSARLLLRRAFIELMDLKNWNIPDIPMAYVTLAVQP